MPASKPRAKWYQYRLASVFVLFALVALALGALVGPLPKRVAEEFDRVPDGYLTFSWTAVREADDAASVRWAVKTHWYSEEPFRVQLYQLRSRPSQDHRDSRRDLGLPMYSRAQIIGHNAVLDCEFSFSGNRLTVFQTIDGRRGVVGESSISDVTSVRWLGMSVADVVHGREQRAVFIGRYGGLRLVECRDGTDAGDANVAQVYCEWDSTATHE